MGGPELERERERNNSLLIHRTTARHTQLKRPLLQACLIFITAPAQTTSRHNVPSLSMSHTRLYFYTSEDHH